MTERAVLTKRERGHIRRRGGSLEVVVYTGKDPVTGKDHYVSKSVAIPPGRDGLKRAEKEAERSRVRLLADVDAARAARTGTTLAHAINKWLSISELEVSSRSGYATYIDRFILPALGAVPIKDVSVQMLDLFYADLRRCRARCSGNRSLSTASPDRTTAARLSTVSGMRTTAARRDAGFSSAARTAVTP